MKFLNKDYSDPGNPYAQPNCRLDTFDSAKAAKAVAWAEGFYFGLRFAEREALKDLKELREKQIKKELGDVYK
jgi:hypothetical protein